MFNKEKAWMEINMEALRHNYKAVESSLNPGCSMLPVLKADAYGVGAKPLAALYEELGAAAFSVTTMAEAMGLREYGIRAPLVLLGPIDPSLAEMAAEHNILPPVLNMGQAAALSAALAGTGKTLTINIKLDAGLGRLGLYLDGRLSAAVDEVMEILALPNLYVEALFTHITSSELPGGKELDLHQLELFRQAKEETEKRAGRGFKAHCLSSYPLYDHAEHQYDFARVGIILTCPYSPAYEKLGLKHAVSIKSKIVQVKDLPKGVPISYGPMFVTLAPMKIAVAAIGFSVGLRRSLSNSGFMMVRGQKAPIVGKICCDYTILDVSHIEGAAEGDIATLAGVDGDVSQHIYELAKMYPASIAEVVSGFNERLPRVYV